jgi:hypothetical protein
LLFKKKRALPAGASERAILWVGLGAAVTQHEKNIIVEFRASTQPAGWLISTPLKGSKDQPEYQPSFQNL